MKEKEKGRKKESVLLPYKPEDWPRIFEQHINAGDLAAALELYAPEAHFIVPQSGATLVGRDEISKALSGLIDARTRFHSQIIRAVTVGDIAQLYTDFEGTMVDGSGNTVATGSKAIEILRRQPDGSWKLIVGDPNGRECER